jgi:hypothetical protein
MRLADRLAAARIALAGPIIYLLFVESVAARWVASGLFAIAVLFHIVGWAVGRREAPTGTRRTLRIAATPLLMAAVAIALIRWDVFRGAAAVCAYVLAGGEVVGVFARLFAPRDGRMPASNACQALAVWIESALFGFAIVTTALQTLPDIPGMVIGIFDLIAIGPVAIAAALAVLAAVLALIEPRIRSRSPALPCQN